MQVFPEITLHIVPDAGHSSHEPGIEKLLVEVRRLDCTFEVHNPLVLFLIYRQRILLPTCDDDSVNKSAILVSTTRFQLMIIGFHFKQAHILLSKYLTYNGGICNEDIDVQWISR
jgi:hypothetical protein